MTTTAKLTPNQQSVFDAVGDDWRSTSEVSRIAGTEARFVLLSLYTRRLVHRRRIDDGRSFEWQLEPV